MSGLSSNIFTALWLSILFTFPMFIGRLYTFQPIEKIDVESLIAGTIVEQVLWKNFILGDSLFGQIFRNSNFGFIPSIILGAVVFACGYLYQSQNINELIGIFMITFFRSNIFCLVVC